MNAIFQIPPIVNEPTYNYAPGSAERAHLLATIEKMRAETVDVPMFIGNQEVRSGSMVRLSSPHNHKHTLGHFHRSDGSHVTQAIDAALATKAQWAAMPWQDRAAIFLKAAELLSGPYRYILNAATMMGQSKSAHQAEIDAACELIDFWRFNVKYMAEIYTEQPVSVTGVWNRVEWRPLEGFVFALTPFNFTAIAGNLPTCVAMMGNTVVWKPADTQVFAAYYIMKILQEAGLPAGVINLIYPSGPVAGDVIFKHPDFAGIHFTGSTGVFKHIWKQIGNNIDVYKGYPRIVGETGGKDFILAHPSAKLDVLATAIVRGAFEFQGQKCSAASRVYIPQSLWPALLERLKADIATIKMGPTEDLSNFFNAVIDEKSFDKLAGFIDRAKTDAEAEVVIGGGYDKSEGYFIEPTVIKTTNPRYVTMCEELFGPVLTIYVYNDEDFEATLSLIDQTSDYALTGAIISQDRYAINLATERLQQSAGNFYINDKCTGAVVGQQPFGGARGSGTNDKAGSKINLLRWASPRTIKEVFNPPVDYKYPFLG